MAEMIEMQDFAEDTEQIPEENIDEAASDDDSETETAEEQADSEQSETAEPMPKEAAQVPEINYDQFLPILDFSKVSEEEICGAACNKLLQDSYFGMNGFPVIACFLWAYNKAKVDLAFAKQVCVKSKNFNKAFEYLKKTVMSYRSGTSGVGMDHRQIFAILEEYFALDDAEIARKDAEAKAKAEQERKANAAKRAAKTKAEKKSAAKDSDNAKKKAPKSAKEKKEKKAEPPQISFDDLLGGVC